MTGFKRRIDPYFVLRRAAEDRYLKGELERSLMFAQAINNQQTRMFQKASEDSRDYHELPRYASN